MDSRCANLKCWGLVVALAAGWSSLAFAQATASSGQAIQFSSPAGSDDAAESPSLTPKAAQLPDFSGAPQSSSVFNFGPPATAEALPRPQIFSPAQQRARDMAEQKKSWVLMTPAEILGVKTPEQMMGITERDAAGQEKKLTPLERYWERQNTPRMAGTNGYQPDNGLGRMSFLDEQNPPSAANALNEPSARTMDSKSIWNKLLNNNPDVDASRQDQGGVWQQLLGTPSPVATAPTPARLAEQERFRQLLGAASPAAAVAPARARSYFSSSPDSSVDPILGELKVNPVGASYAPLSSGIGVPKGVLPLPGITAPGRVSAAAKPALMPQAPPWVMNGPELFTPPQRKF